ncbi:hypothetical protein [Paenibacillus agilis]|uniref:Uncharacterized protein n=1 Tax=Paenibacillus agilis TaxID=3020863 RepID=A0A559ID56_9BACL|nr:hypothetical protein [Paenibacillus agilis]TVX85575.1 hypothetical protein FPZ44_24785 [Paenibacillus agilis]
MEIIQWSDLANPRYLELLSHKNVDEAQEYFDLDIQAGFFSIVRAEKRDSFLSYLKDNSNRLKLSRRAKIEMFKLWLGSKLMRIDNSTVLEKFIVRPISVQSNHDGSLEVEFKCVTGDIIKTNKVHVIIDKSVENSEIVLEYMIPKMTFTFVSYWDQKTKKSIIYYELKNIHGIRIRMFSMDYE